MIDAGWEDPDDRLVADPQRFGQLGKIIESAAAAKTRVGLWLTPWAQSGTKVYEELREAGLLVLAPDGSPYKHTLGNDPSDRGTLIDFTSPAAVKWWKDRLSGLIDLGVRVFKVDFGEQLPADARLADGRTGAEVHNEYPYLYNKATLDAVRGSPRQRRGHNRPSGMARLPGALYLLGRGPKLGFQPVDRARKRGPCRSECRDERAGALGI